ncbi:MAG: acetate--CoA ligase family protein, partial [Thermoplasmata archaeon]|nr:acetate--CoA ligase family protein [Thermoplasmata archaeon]
ESKNVLEEYDVPVVKTQLATTAEDAIELASELRYPVVLKIASPDILHKIDAGGVKTFLDAPDEVKNAFKEIIVNAKKYDPKARILGVTVQNQIPRGVEVIVGGLKDPVFGPCVMFGMGGTWVEVMNDVSFRLAPTDIKGAQEMISEIKAYPLLTRYRGSEGVAIDKIADIIVKISNLMAENLNIAEIDVNPIFARVDSVVAVDARIVLEEKS